MVGGKHATATATCSKYDYTNRIPPLLVVRFVHVVTCTASSTSSAPAADHVGIELNFLYTHIRYHLAFALGKAGKTTGFTSKAPMPRTYHIQYTMI